MTTNIATRSRKRTLNAAALIALLGAGTWAIAAPAGDGKGRDQSPATKVTRGKYLVTAGKRHARHTPLKLGPRGPERDMTLMLSGHPEALAMPAAPKLPAGPWMLVGSATMTAWSGPWGVSFSANLTPDKETGLGTWTARTFIDA